MNKAKLLWSAILLIIFSLVFGPTAYATFVREASSSSDTGYGYGYGYTYETGVWDYGYGYGSYAGSTGGGGGGGNSTMSPTGLSQAQLIAYYEKIIAMLQALITKKSGGKMVPHGQVVKTRSLHDIVLTLQLGSRGQDVRSLQQFLIEQETGPAAKKLALTGATGIFGQSTMKALKEYQKDNGIKATGIYGPATQQYVKSQLVQ